MRSPVPHAGDRTRARDRPSPEREVRGYLFCVNPGAGRGRGATRLERLLASVPPPAGAEVEIVEAASLDEMSRAVGRAAPGVVPIAAGGDGTVAMLARAVLDGGRTPAVGIVPLGTGNIFAAELGISRPSAGLPWTREAGPLWKRVDVLRTTHPDAPLALVSVSTGFEGAFIHRYHDRRRLGRPFAALLGAAEARKKWRISLEVDGARLASPEAPIFSAGLYNTRSYAGDVAMSPAGDPGDGVAEAAAYRSAGSWCASILDGLRNAPRTSRHGVSRGTWRSARLRADAPLQIDGEPVESREVRVELDPSALTVAVSLATPAG